MSASMMIFGVVLSTLAPAQATTGTGTAASGAVVDTIGEDPFAEDIFAPSEGAPPALDEPAAPEPTAPAPTPRPASKASNSEPSLPTQPAGVADTTPATPTTDPLYLGPYVRLSGLVVRDPSLALVSPIGTLVRIEGGFELAPFGAQRGPAFELGLSAGFQADTSFDTVDGQLALTSIQVGALYRLPIWTYLAGYGRVTGAIDFAHLRFTKGFLEKEVDQTSVGGSVGASAGLELTIPIGYTPMGGKKRQASNWLGFFLEFGYALHSVHDFSEARRSVGTDTEPARIEVVAQDIGDVDLSGWTWRLGASFRF